MSKGRVSPSVPARPYLLRDLRDPAFAAGYLSLCAEEEVPGDFMAALRSVVDAHGGIGAIARRTGLNRQQLYKTLSIAGNPEFHTLRAILDSVGFALAVVPKPPVKRRRKSSGRGKDLVNPRNPAQLERSHAA